MRLHGRDRECAVLDDIVAGARTGRSATLVLRGEPGIGKTALLRHAAERAPGSLWVSGVRTETDFPYAALHRLLIPLLPGRDSLPRSQRAALEVACGLADGPPADLFLVSLAALTLLARQPRVCVIDDAQWLDEESLRALAFVGRRLHAEGLVLLFGVRADDDELLAGLPERALAGLDRDAARALLGEVADGPVNPALADHIARATGGNPLALTDLAHELTAEQWSGVRPVPEPVPVGSRLEAHYSGQVRAYPPATRAWLLLAAANAGADPALAVAAAQRLGIDVTDASPAEADRLVTGSPPVTFRHPLVLSAVHGVATSAERRSAHQALAAVIVGAGDADRRAWHLAAAAAGPDETVAAELERRAERAGARGGHTARATFLSRAAELTPGAADRARRQVHAAAAHSAAGDPTRAYALLAGTDEALLDDADRGTALMVQAVAAVTSGVPDANLDSCARCLSAAEAFGSARPGLAQAAVLQAIEHAASVEDAARGTDEQSIARVARRLAGPDPSGVPELLLAAYADYTLDGHTAGAPTIHRAVAAFLAPGVDYETVLEHVVVGVNLCTLVWDDRSQRAVLELAEAAALRTGALRVLDVIHHMAAMAGAVMGRLNDADRHETAGLRLRRAIGLPPVPRHPELAAWRAAPDEREPLTAAARAFESIGMSASSRVTRHSLALTDLGLGDYAAAAWRLRPMTEPERPRRYAWTLPDLIEASVRSSDRPTARRALDDLATAATACGTPWALGVLERSRGLMAPADAAEAHFRSAVSALQTTFAYGDLARSHLVLGEWLRRKRRRRDAQTSLRTALEMFEAVRATSFVARTRRELSALGGNVPDPVRGKSETALTPQEAAVARLARDGGTNAEIAANLFLSASTVDYHLRKVYRKLGVRSRRQLRGSLQD